MMPKMQIETFFWLTLYQVQNPFENVSWGVGWVGGHLGGDDDEAETVKGVHVSASGRKGCQSCLSECE